jgi:hypothetical protein
MAVAWRTVRERNQLRVIIKRMGNLRHEEVCSARMTACGVLRSPALV